MSSQLSTAWDREVINTALEGCRYYAITVGTYNIGVHPPVKLYHLRLHSCL